MNMNINFKRVISAQKTTKLFIALMLFLFSLSLSPASLAAASGDALWAKSVTSGSSISNFGSVTVDASGNVYASGAIRGTGTYDFGNGVTVFGTIAGNNIVLVKYDSTGTALWAKSVASGSSRSNFNSVTVDASGNVCAVGYIRGTDTYDFGNGVTASGATAGNNTVLVKYDSIGTVLWAKSVTSGSSGSVFFSVTVDTSGNVYAGGYIRGTGTYDFGNGVSVFGSAGGKSIVLVKYDSTGTALWAKSVTSGSSYSYFTSVTVDTSGNVYAGGFIRGTGTYDFGNGVTASGTSSTYNTVLVKYDSTGTALWAKSVTSGSSNSYFYSVTVDTNGNVYAGGIIEGAGTYDFGNGVTASGTIVGANVVLVKYDSTGTALWAKSVTSGSSYSRFYSVTIDANGNVYAGGYIRGTGTYDFGNGVTASGTSGFTNIVLVKYDSTGTALWTKSVTSGSGSSEFKSVTVDASGNVYTGGFISGTGTYDFGNGVTASGMFRAGNNIVLVKYRDHVSISPSEKSSPLAEHLP